MASLESSAQAIIEGLIAQGLNFVAIDFDQTIVDIHTGGKWIYPPEDLAPHVRPFFRVFIPNAIAAGLYVAVVTFSPQVPTISTILKQVLGEAVASRITIRGNDDSWEYVGRGSMNGKQQHMASAAEEINSKYKVDISRATTLLIDDDVNNIKIALDNRVRAIRLFPNDPDALIADLRDAFITE